MKTPSLKKRISLCIAALMLTVISILSGVAYHEFRESLWRNMDMTLQSDLYQIKNLLLLGALKTEVQREIRDFLNPHGEWQKIEYQIWYENTADNTVEMFMDSDILDALTEQYITPPKQDDLILVNLNRDKKLFRVLWARYHVPNSTASSPQFLNVVLAISAKNAIHEVGEFIRVLVIVGGIVAWAAFALTCRILQWGLQPIDDLSHQMSVISEDNLKLAKQKHSILLQELRPFVQSWEAMLCRLTVAMQEQKRFTADAAHELKTPVALIKSTLQLAQAQKRTADFYEMTISNALEDVERLNCLIGQLLDLSRIESDKDPSKHENINLREILEDIIEYYKSFSKACGLILNQQLCNAQIAGNKSLIWKLFGNIIDNAIKYAPRSTTITVSMHLEDHVVVTTVHDEGGDIPEKEWDLLFNRFYRISKARDHNSGGSGLGLSIAKGIAVLHSGNIHIESNRKKGTSLIVTLPTNSVS
jgi:signal transduction histidine kinase